MEPAVAQTENQPDNGSQDDLPDLIALSEDSDDGDYRQAACSTELTWVDEDQEDPLTCLDWEHVTYGDDDCNYSSDDQNLIQWLSDKLTESQPFPGDGRAVDPSFIEGKPRFLIE